LSVLIFGNLLCVVNKIGGGVNNSKDFFFFVEKMGLSHHIKRENELQNCGPILLHSDAKPTLQIPADMAI
jgi:hypothetical protein